MRCFGVLLIVAGCGGDDLSTAPEANPLGWNDNILPYPSSLYEKADGTLDVPVGAFPGNHDTGAPFDPTMHDFWATGVVSNACTGACDCAAGNCGALRPPMYGGH